MGRGGGGVEIREGEGERVESNKREGDDGREWVRVGVGLRNNKAWKMFSVCLGSRTRQSFYYIN
jgi:hypothetical protein